MYLKMAILLMIMFIYRENCSVKFILWEKKMSSVFKSPKVKVVKQEEVQPELVDNNEIEYELNKKRKRKMGAISQLLANDSATNNKTTLGS